MPGGIRRERACLGKTRKAGSVADPGGGSILPP
jgi:hypothetical protein